VPQLSRLNDSVTPKVNSEAEITGGEIGMSFLKQEARAIERFRIIEVAEAEWVSEAPRRFGCSRTTVYKLLTRYPGSPSPRRWWSWWWT